MAFDWRYADDWYDALAKVCEGIAALVGLVGAFLVGAYVADFSIAPISLLEVIVLGILGGAGIGGLTYAALRVALWILFFVILVGPFILIAAAVLAFWVFMISYLSQTYV